MGADLIGVLDVGKTNVRLALVSADTGAVAWRSERQARPLPGLAVPCLDVDGIEQWLIAALASAPERRRIKALVPVAHGAAAVLMDRDDRPILAPDYEATEFESIADEYQAVRDPYAETYSPFLPLGLNLGRQLYFVQTRLAPAFGRVARILLYPQYWAWRLSGTAASEITSLGCHTDLWRPLSRSYSALAERQGWATLLPAMKRADDSLGSIRPDLARTAGLDPACRVLCGIHDSNASYLCHLAARPLHEPLTVVSSGTWTIVMARGSDLTRLHEDRDMLANVDAFGAPVATARFMGGREYSAIAGESGARASPSLSSVQSLIHKQAMALPSFAGVGGPFAGRPGRLTGADTLGNAERAGLATIYCALMTDLLVDLLGARGDIVIDGPLAANPVFPGILAALRTTSAVLPAGDGAGAAMAAALLAGMKPISPRRVTVDPAPLDGLEAYRASWRTRAAYPSP